MTVILTARREPTRGGADRPAAPDVALGVRAPRGSSSGSRPVPAGDGLGWAARCAVTAARSRDQVAVTAQRPRASATRPARRPARCPGGGRDPGDDRPGRPRRALRGLDRALERPGPRARSGRARPSRSRRSWRPRGRRGSPCRSRAATPGWSVARCLIVRPCCCSTTGLDRLAPGGRRRADRRGRRGRHGRPAGRACPCRGAALRRRPRRPRLRHARRDGRDERRRAGRLRLRDDARAGARARGRARRRSGRAHGRPAPQGQLRLRPDGAARRQRGHPRGDHRGRGRAAPGADGSPRSRCWPSTTWREAVAAGADGPGRASRRCSPPRSSTPQGWRGPRRRWDCADPMPLGARAGCCCSRSPTAGPARASSRSPTRSSPWRPTPPQRQRLWALRERQTELYAPDAGAARSST